MNIIRQPLTVEEIKPMLEKDTTYITGIVPIELNYVINGDFQSFLYELSERLIGCTLLMDISYTCRGTEDDGLTLLIEVSGDVCEILPDDLV